MFLFALLLSIIFFHSKYNIIDVAITFIGFFMYYLFFMSKKYVILPMESSLFGSYLSVHGVVIR